MAVSEEVLAWRSGQGSGEMYTSTDLSCADKVQEVFAACKAAQEDITAEGWSFFTNSFCNNSPFHFLLFIPFAC